MSTIALKLPKKYVVMDNDLMEYVEGGFGVPVKVGMISKHYCLGVAAGLVSSGKISWWNSLIIAKEIRGHAVAYYGLSGLDALGISNATLADMKERANPIDLTDGYDSRAGVVAACELIWKLP